MISTNPALTRILAVLGIGLALASQATAAQTYNITDLGVATGYPISEAQAINAGGQVVGTLYDAGRTQARAFLYTGGPLNLLSSTIAMTARDINDSGRIVGAMITGAGASHGFVYEGGVIGDLGTLGGAISYGVGVNVGGLICGASTNGDGRTHAFLVEGGIMYDIHVLAQAAELMSPTPGNIIYSHFSEARDINNGREIVGWFTAPNAAAVTTERAFYYRNERVTELSSLGGLNSRALAISNNGHIVGWSQTGTGVRLATMFYLNGQVRSLGTPTGTAGWSEAYAVNDSGVVVGSADGIAFVYEGGVNTDLNTRIPAGSGWTLQSANGINNTGRIVGYGTVGGETHAFLLTPVTTPPGGGGGGGGTGGTLCGNGVGIPLALATLCLMVMSTRRAAGQTHRTHD
ncbi:MAG TPA: hypothetical protein VLM89_16210 [Phycisphaerae bacterium]|nr:hypothetical protein [Phycisphaerae bacterium]